MQSLKPKLDRPVVVEGKYDKIKLDSIFDGIVITTDGFGIFKNEEKRAFIRAISKEKGIIIATDSDGAGQLIRGHLKGIVPPDKVVCVYIPCVKGKEKRKKSPSAEGFLGVEGTDAETLKKLFSPYYSENTALSASLAPQILYELGFSGGKNSALMRKKLLSALGLPQGLSVSSLCEAVNYLYDKETIYEYIEKIRKEEI